MLIAIILPDFRGGGVERIRIVLAHEFARAGHDVEFVLMQARGDLLAEAKVSFPVVDLNVLRVSGLPFALPRYLRRHRPDALLAAMWPLTVIAPISARLSGRGCNVLVFEYDSLSVQYREWGRMHRTMLCASMAVGYRLANNRVSASAGVASDIASSSGLPLGSFDVIHNPVPPRPDPSEDAIREAEVLWGAQKGACVATVGSMKKIESLIHENNGVEKQFEDPVEKELKKAFVSIRKLDGNNRTARRR